MKFIRTDIKGTSVSYTLCVQHSGEKSIDIVMKATAERVTLSGGSPLFDNKDEERIWNNQVELALMAHHYLRQGAVVPSDELLQEVVGSYRKPEADFS